MTDLEVALHAARAGSEAILTWSSESIEAEMKGAVNPVTEADRQAEAAILAILAEHRPDDSVLAEESGGAITSGRAWIVDPLDGTINFVHGVPHVAVSIALFGEGEALVGVILDVYTGDIYAASAGQGATRNGLPIAVSQRANLGDALIATGFPYDRRERAETYAQDVGRALKAVRGLRRLGSAALDLAYVAAGRFDGYWERNLAAWDAAAGLLIVQEAGGRVTTLAGEPLAIGEFDSILASNPLIHAELRAILVP